MTRDAAPDLKKALELAQDALDPRESAPGSPAGWEMEAVGSRPPLPRPSSASLLAAADGLDEHPSDRFARERHGRARPLAWGALAASALVNAGLALVLAGQQAEAPAPPPRTVRLVFAAAPLAPPPPPPLKGGGVRPATTPAVKVDAPRPVRPRVEPSPNVLPSREPEPPVVVAQVTAPASSEPLTEGDPAGSEQGVLGGTEGGVVGGVEGGIVGGVLGAPLMQGAEEPELVELAKLKLRRRVAPDYPSLARKAGIAGLVVLEIIVDPSGNVADVRVVRSVPLLDKAAMAAVSQWEFEAQPGSRRARALVEVEFELA